MVKQKTNAEMTEDKGPATVVETIPLWQLDIAEVTGHNLEARGREEVNRLLGSGWRLLHIYTLKYQEEGVWRERPMAILGRMRNGQNHFQLE
jgi:FtsZ-binding cell division protein ZapB